MWYFQIKQVQLSIYIYKIIPEIAKARELPVSGTRESVCPKLHRCPFPRERLLRWEHHECRKQQTSHQVYKKLNTTLQGLEFRSCVEVEVAVLVFPS